MGWRRRLAMIIFSIAKRRKRSRRCPQQLVDILAVHITIRTSCSLVGIFVSWRWVARVASGSGRVTRQTRAGREVMLILVRMCRETETVVKMWSETSLNSAPSSSLNKAFSVSRHILRSPRVPASSAAATRARRETPCNITRHAPRDGTRLEDAHFINLMHLQGTCKFRLSARL